MSDRILSVVGRTKPELNRQAAIGILKDMLAQAEAGEIVEVAVAAIYADQTCATSASRSSNRFLMAGAIAQLLFSVQSSLDQASLNKD